MTADKNLSFITKDIQKFNKIWKFKAEEVKQKIFPVYMRIKQFKIKRLKMYSFKDN